MKKLASNPKPITAKQYAFLDAYLETGNVQQAMDKSGYRTSTNIYDFMRRADVRQYIDNYYNMHGISEKFLVDKMMDILGVNLSDIIEWDADGNYVLTPSDKLTPAQKTAIKEVRMRENGRIVLKLVDRVEVLNMLAKIRGLYKIRPADQSAAPTPVVTINLTSTTEPAFTIDHKEE